MRIEKQNNILEMLQQNSTVEEKNSNAVFAAKASVTKSKHSDTQSVFIKDSTYLNPALSEKKELEEELESGTALDATARKNQMAVLSHTTSEEDYAKMQEEGFSLDTTNGNTIVTVTDKIKMQIAKSGGDISCFGDDLDMKQLEKMTGNKALARQVKQKLREADLPASEENMEECMKAYYLADALNPLTAGGLKYMLDNKLSPTIENLYKATYSGSAGYMAISGDTLDISGIQPQIERIIKSAGLSVNEQTLSDSKWLLANDIALTAENLNYLGDLQEYVGNLSGEELTDAIVDALAEGHSAEEALMIPPYSQKERALDAVSVIENATDIDLKYLIEQGLELTIKNLKMAANQEKSQSTVLDTDLRLLKARRQLEETRLAMTAEANYSLLKKGISIDTKPLEKLVEALKNEENQYYTKLLESQGVEVTDENVSLFAETSEKLSAIKSVPAYVLGMPKADVSNIQGVYHHGTALKAAMEKANQSYETLMTAPRSDMGDSYQKAFRNIDEILADLNMELTEENRRAVRILAYNELEINTEAIVEMKAADKEVQRTFKNLTPGVVVEMLRRGENPLEMDFSMLNKTAENIKQDLNGDDSQKFSEFLWKLEKNHEITEEERSSYVGVYRLIHQVEQTDGAAIGALIHQGASLTLKNLLTAVRSGNKQKKMDVSVDDNYGEREQSAGYQNSITEQIMTAYQNNCLKDAKEALTPARLAELEKQNIDFMELTPEQFAAVLQELETEDAGTQSEYIKEQLESMRQCVNTSEEVYRFLEQYDIPNTVQNILAMESMITDRNQLYKKLFAQKGLAEREVSSKDLEPDSAQEEIEAIKQQLIEDFGNAVAEPKEMAEAQEALGKLAENVMKTMIESDEVTSIDIREARLMQAQIAIQKKMSKQETYSVPVLVGNEITNVSLKIVRGVEKRGMVDIVLENEMAGKIAATFQTKDNEIRGTIAAEREEADAKMAGYIDAFVKAMQEKEEKIQINTVHIPNLDLNHFSAVSSGKNTTDSAIDFRESKASFNEKEAKEDSSQKVQTARLYRIAESFIKTMKEIYK